MKEKMKVCSSPTEEGLIKMINHFFMSENWIIKDGQVFNTKLNRTAGEIVKKRGRYIFYS